jgi:RNA recognition motif-containing protein
LQEGSSDDSVTQSTPSGSNNGHGSGSGSAGEDVDADSDSSDSSAASALGRSQLFIGDLPRAISDDQILALFAPYGTVVSFTRKRASADSNTPERDSGDSADAAVPASISSGNGGSGGSSYAFVRLSSAEEARRARDALHGRVVSGQRLRVGWAQRNSTLFVGDLDGTLSSGDLIRAFRRFGPLVEDECFVQSGAGKYGFVRFLSRDDAQRAKAAMQGAVIGKRAIRIGWGDGNTQR